MQLSQEEQDKFGVGEIEENNKDSEDVIKEPISKTNFCHLCRRKFDNYLIHIETVTHKNNINKNPLIINTAQNTFKRINQFWNNKNNNNLNNNLKSNEKNDKIENNKLFGTSISSFSSAISTFKCEDNLIKDINSFMLEQEISDNEKNNDKENQNENKAQKNRIRHTKYNSHFISPTNKEKLLVNSRHNLEITNPETFKNNIDKYINEIEKVKTRGLTTFYFNDRHNKDIQEYEGKQYNTNYEFGGKILEYNEEKSVIEIRNKLSVGDSLEIIIPGQIEEVEKSIQEIEKPKTPLQITKLAHVFYKEKPKRKIWMIK